MARTAVNHVAAHFVESNRVNPIINFNGKVHIDIDRQTKGYKKEYSSTKHQKALPPVVFKEILDMSFLPRELACAWLVCAALYFVMRSCEYCWMTTGMVLVTDHAGLLIRPDSLI